MSDARGAGNLTFGRERRLTAGFVTQDPLEPVSWLIKAAALPTRARNDAKPRHLGMVMRSPPRGRRARRQAIGFWCVPSQPSGQREDQGWPSSQYVAPRAILARPALDRPPISGFHERIFWLVGAGMFFDSCDLYIGTNCVQHWRADFPPSPRPHNWYR